VCVCVCGEGDGGLYHYSVMDVSALDKKLWAVASGSQ
jgi:hypothetical protein